MSYRARRTKLHNQVIDLLNEGEKVVIDRSRSTRGKKVVTESARPAKFVVSGKQGSYSWALKVRGREVARSAQTFRTNYQAKRSIESFIKHSASASVVDE